MTTDGGYARTDARRSARAGTCAGRTRRAEAAPLLCAGPTTFNALRNAGGARRRRGGGSGGLAASAISRCSSRREDGLPYRGDLRVAPSKAELAVELGAHRYIDSESEDAVAVLRSLGGAKVVPGNGTYGAPGMSALVPGLAARGRLVVVAVPGDPISLTAMDLRVRARAVVGASHGNQSSTTSRPWPFSPTCRASGPMIETFPLEQAQAAYDRMMRADVRSPRRCWSAPGGRRLPQQHDNDG